MTRISKRNLELAQQQFVGYQHGVAGHGIESLAEGMGLTAEEWAALRETSGLSDSDKQALDRYFQ